MRPILAVFVFAAVLLGGIFYGVLAIANDPAADW